MHFPEFLLTDDSAQRNKLLSRFCVILGLVCVFLAALPHLIALGIQPPGKAYLGEVFNTDDHLVYMGWMRQAMEGNFLFENRFTTDPQPKLTIHLYFLVLGNLARIFGIIGTFTLARLGLTYLFVHLLGQIFRRTDLNLFVCKLAITLICFGGGLGFLAWQMFGRLIVTPQGKVFAPIFGGHLPTDVWQPEIFVFPSMLTNSLFMASLCLMLWIVLEVLKARESSKGVWRGALAFLLLMNIHSYDVLTLAFVLLGMLVAMFGAKKVEPKWVGRVALMSIGALPSAAWFWHVLQSDAVFQARAATPTFTVGFRPFLGGLLPAILLCVWAIASDAQKRIRSTVSALGFFLLLLVSWIAAGGTGDYFVLTTITWAVFFISALAICFGAGRKEPIWNLMLAWLMCGLAAPYFPVLFQRKMAAGLIIPVATLAAIGIACIMQRFERHQRNSVTFVFLIMICTSSVLWIQREAKLIAGDVSTTTMHPAFLSKDALAMINIVQRDTNSVPVIAAIPGVPTPLGPDSFGSPIIPDLNPVFVGLGGARAIAGHWSETPDYSERRAEMAEELFAPTSTPSRQQAYVAKYKVTYVVGLNPEAYPNANLASINNLGEMVYKGNQFLLIRVRR